MFSVVHRQASESEVYIAAPECHSEVTKLHCLQRSKLPSIPMCLYKPHTISHRYLKDLRRDYAWIKPVHLNSNDNVEKTAPLMNSNVTSHPLPEDSHATKYRSNKPCLEPPLAKRSKVPFCNELFNLNKIRVQPAVLSS